MAHYCKKMAFPNIDGYVVSEKLGSGTYSTVYKAYAKVGARTVVAIKCVDKSRIKNSGAAVDNLITEIRLLKSLTHRHIVKMHNFTWDDRNIYIIMEYCCGGDLSHYIRRYGRVPETQVRYFLQQLASALKFLYEKGVMHLDLKPHNLLLDKDPTDKYILKVADFGFAQHMEAGAARGARGSPLYMAPEALRGDCSPAADLWSVGVIMYECLFGRAPYSSNTFQQLVDKIQSQAPIQIPPAGCAAPSAGCVELLKALLVHDPRLRLPHEDFFRHEYIDLEHMPTPENYEMAVCAIKRAISLEEAGTMGGRRAALAEYTRALRVLVGRLPGERDPARRAALAGKLASYMQRAEELKQLLKAEASQSTNPAQSTTPALSTTPGQPAAPRREVTAAAEEFSALSVDPLTTLTPCSPCPAGGTPSGPVEMEQEEDVPPSASASASARSPRFALKRLFARKDSLPWDLEPRDSALTSEPSRGAPRDNDACRIT